MMKNMVIVKHMTDNGKYLFYVPNGIVLAAGSVVVCNTRRGPGQLAVCCCNNFAADPEVVCPLFGTTPDKMMYVTGRVEYDLFTVALDEEKKEELGDG